MSDTSEDKTQMENRARLIEEDPGLYGIKLTL